MLMKQKLQDPVKFLHHTEELMETHNEKNSKLTQESCQYSTVACNYIAPFADLELGMKTMEFCCIP